MIRIMIPEHKERKMISTREHDQGNGDEHLTEENHTRATREATREQDGLMPAGFVLEGAWYRPPASTDAPGLPGMRAYDEDYIYFCVAVNVWRRVPLQDWAV